MSGIAAVVALVLALIGGGAVQGSQEALPGEVLYPVKTLVEAVRLQATSQEQARLQLHLCFAEERLAEAQRLADQGTGEGVATALENYGRHLAAVSAMASNEEGDGKAEVWSRVQERMQVHVTVLTQVGESLADSPGSAGEALQLALANAERLRERLGQTDGDGEEGDDDQGTPPVSVPGPPDDRGQRPEETPVPELARERQEHRVGQPEPPDTGADEAEGQEPGDVPQNQPGSEGQETAEQNREREQAGPQAAPVAVPPEVGQDEGQNEEQPPLDPGTPPVTPPQQEPAQEQTQEQNQVGPQAPPVSVPAEPGQGGNQDWEQPEADPKTSPVPVIPPQQEQAQEQTQEQEQNQAGPQAGADSAQGGPSEAPPPLPTEADEGQQAAPTPPTPEAGPSPSPPPGAGEPGGRR